MLYLTALPPALLYWLTWLLTSLVAAGLLIFPQWGQLSLQTPIEDILAIQAVSYIIWGYVMACGLLLLWAWRRARWLQEIAESLLFVISALALGKVLATVWVSHQILEQGHWGMSNLFEVSVLLLALLGSGGVWVQRQYKMPWLGVALVPIYIFFATILLWLESLGQAGPRDLVPALQSNILPWHVFTTFVAYGAFMVAAASSAVTLVAHWRGIENLVEQSDLITARCIALGFPLFTIAILLGSWWAYQAWGGYWMWDPKETWALIVWLIYAGYLHARLTHQLKPVLLAWWSLIGFAATLFCYLGVNLFLGGLHSYGQIL